MASAAKGSIYPESLLKACDDLVGCVRLFSEFAVNPELGRFCVAQFLLRRERLGEVRHYYLRTDPGADADADETREEQIAVWNKDFSRRLKNTGSAFRLGLLQITPEDEIIRLIYHAECEGETLRPTLLSSTAREISAPRLATEYKTK